MPTSSVVGDTSANNLDNTDGKLRDDPLIFPDTDHSNGQANHGRYMVLNGSLYHDVDNSGMLEKRFSIVLVL